MTDARPGDRLAFADGLRGLAALWVVLFHASEGKHIERLTALLPRWLDVFVFEWGHLGVVLFFVLSGFVMMQSVRGIDDSRPFGARFLARRLVRLTPPYYASIALVLAYGLLKSAIEGAPANAPSAPTVVAHAFYLQDIVGLPTISVVYWSLGIEIQFYLAFVLLLAAMRRYGRLRVLAASSVVALPWAFGWVVDPVFRGSFLPFWFAFMLGAVVNEALAARRAVPLLSALLVALVAAWLASRSSVVGAAVGAAALLLGGRAVPPVGRWLRSRPLQFLGLVSYSLYLTHNQVSGGTAFVVRRFLPPTPGGELALLACVVAACLLVAWVLLVIVERPSMAASRRIALPRRAAAAG